MKLTNSKTGGGHLLTNAFTLIELLAVIIILAIVALIATPIILDVVEDARISAGKSESQMIYSGINNYCETIKLKKQMGTLTSEDVDCESKTTFTTEEISKMVNLGNSKVLENTYNGTLTYLKVESNGHIFILENGKFVEEGEIAFTPGECFTYEDITLVESFDINYDTCVTYVNNLNWGFSTEEIDLYCKGESVDGYNMKDDINNRNLDINELKSNNVITNVVEKEAILITGYDNICGGYDVVIPNTIEEKQVISIGNYAFSENQLTSVTIPDSVITIGDYVFYRNQLTNVTIGNSVTTIGDSAFRFNQLTSINLPNSMTTVGNYAFYGNQLTNVTIGNSVTTIGDKAFSENHLTSINLPNSISTIGTEAFCNNKLASLDLSNLTDIQSISYDAFKCNLITPETFIGINEYNYDYFDFSCPPS